MIIFIHKKRFYTHVSCWVETDIKVLQVTSSLWTQSHVTEATLLSKWRKFLQHVHRNNLRHVHKKCRTFPAPRYRKQYNQNNVVSSFHNVYHPNQNITRTSGKYRQKLFCALRYRLYYTEPSSIYCTGPILTSVRLLKKFLRTCEYTSKIFPNPK